MPTCLLTLLSLLFSIYLHAQFTDINAGLINLYQGSTAWGDYDNDGDLDVLITGLRSGSTCDSKVYRNDNGIFTDIDAGLTGVFLSSASWGDFDNDGDLDIFIMGHSPGVTAKIYRNDSGIFSDINAGLTGCGSGSAAWGDIDSDGDLDLIISGASDSGYITKIYRNDNGFFTDINAGLPGLAYSAVAWGDYDRDGDIDLFISGITDPDDDNITRIYHNDGGVFTDINAQLTGVHSCSGSWGDYDNDGDLDLVYMGTEDVGTTRYTKIYRNDNNVFNEAAGLTGMYSGSIGWGDYDNDGDLDIFQTGVYGPSNYATKLFSNDNGVFSNVNSSIPGFQASFQWGDYDNDSRLDILLVGYSTDRQTKIYHNDSPNLNAPPSQPDNLLAAMDEDNLIISWQPPNDDHTPSSGLSYNFALGTDPDSLLLFCPMSDPDTGYRRIPQPGNVGQNTSLTLGLDPNQVWYFGVQAIDTAFSGSSFALTGYSPIQALYSVSDTLGYVPLDVAFTDSSSSIVPIISWEWDFQNDGVVDSTEQNPSFTYTDPGSYDVSLTVSDGVYPDTLLKTGLVTVLGPQAEFTVSATSGYAPLQLSFTDLSHGNSLLYEWDFDNDGLIDSNDQNPTWTYNAPGIYTVSLTVSYGIHSDTETKTGYITVLTPEADFSADVTNGFLPLTVQFTDQSVGAAMTWEWDFDNDGVIDSHEQNPLWVYQYPGTYSVSLTVEFPLNIDTETKIDYVTGSLNPAICRYVPTQYSTIQAAIDASSDGDYILVADGIYYENLQIVGKQVTLASHYFLDGDTLHIDNTRIDGSQSRNREEASVIAIRPGASPNLSSHIIGFTITHGRGRSVTQNQGGVNVTKIVGGGIYVEQNQPILTRNKVVENDAEDEGGGSYAFQSLPNLGGIVSVGRVNLGGNEFRDNQANVGKDIYIEGTGTRDGISAENCGFSVFCEQDTTVSDYWATSQAAIDYRGCYGQRSAITSDVWVAPDGSNLNDGLSPASPFLTIDHALSLVYGSEDNPVTVHLAPGIYAPSWTGERYPLQMVSWVTLKGSGADETYLDAEATVDNPNRVFNLDKVECAQIKDLTITGGAVTLDKGVNGAGIAVLDAEAGLSGITGMNFSATGDGGCLYVLNSVVDCDSLYLHGNTALSYGGAVFVRNGAATISGSTISQNSAHLGGGIYASASALDLNGCEIVDNATTGTSSQRKGGGVFAADSNGLAIGNSMIKGNSADAGAGIYLQNATDVEIMSNRIVNNTQSVSSYSNGGGGLYWNNACSGIVANNLIANNTAYQGGAGFGLSVLDFRNNTIANNRANYRGGGFYLYNCSPDYLNSILWGNTAASGGGQFWLQDDSCEPALCYCDVQGGSAAFGLYPGSSYTGIYENNLNLNPQFIAPTTGTGSNYNALIANWSIPEASPCVNTGDPATDASLYPLDLAGNPRVDGASIDIGAYEYQFTVAPGIPGNVSIGVSDGQILLQWDAVPTAQSYRVLASEYATGPFELDISSQGTLSLDTGRYTWSMPLNTELRRFYVVKSSTGRERR
jgi:PKD repeat protein